MRNRTLIFIISICLISCTKEIIQQKLTVSVTPANGGTVSPPSNSYEKGSNVSLVATPSGEYLFKQWQGSISGTSNPTFIIMDADKSVTGVFEKRQYPLTLTIEGSGNVKEEIAVVAPQSQYPSGTTVKLTAQPGANYEFKDWSGDLSSTLNPFSIVVNKSINLKVTFVYADKDGDGIPDSKDMDNNTRKGVPVDANGVMLNPVYLDKNGVTIKAFDWTIVGDKGIINGIEYTIVSAAELKNTVKSDADYSKFCTTKITDMSDMFSGKTAIRDITKFDVSNVTNMKGMFSSCTSFNQDISIWDVSKVTNMTGMLLNCYKFNQDIGKWNLSKVTEMDGMLTYCHQLNQDLSKWDVSNVTTMGGMFQGCRSFNGNIKTWNMSKVKNIRYMFGSCTEFNQDLSQWDVSNVTDMEATFASCTKFNQDLSKWDVKNVINMLRAFDFAIVYNQDLSKWNVANVINCENFSRDAYNWTLPKPIFTKCK
jgi:surface protein